MTEIDELATRLGRIEDEREIARLIATYGPAVDAGDAANAVASRAGRRRWTHMGFPLSETFAVR